MYGIVGLALGIVSLVKNIQFQRNKNPKGKAATKLQWAKVLSIAGMFVSILFITYYILVFSYGTFIRF